MGVAASQMERKGVHSELGNRNREIEITNRQLRRLRARLRKLDAWMKEEAIKSAEPNLQDVIVGILDNRRDKTHWQSNSDLKSAAKALLFLQTNHITDMAGLQEKVSAMREEFNNVIERNKKVERRLGVLDEHIKQAEVYMKNKAIIGQYRKIEKQKKREAFYEKHRAEIMLFEAADRYLTGVMNGRSNLPIKAWKAERETLAAEKTGLYLEYHSLKDDVLDAEMLKQGVERIMRDDDRDVQPVRARDVGR